MAAPFRYDDGGRAAAGLRRGAGDCAVRAIAIATGLPYSEVHADLYARQAVYLSTTRQGRERAKGIPGKRRPSRPSPDSGVWREVFHPYLLGLGWRWTPTMTIGSGCQVHARADELPGGRLILRLSRHLTAMLDGVIHDTGDPTRGGTRCVYGYYSREDD